MTASITSIWLVLLVLLSGWCSVLKCRQILKYKPDSPLNKKRDTDLFFYLLALGTAGVFLFRIFFVHQSWRPLTSHVDGLTLLVTLLCAKLMYLEKRGKAQGLSFVGYPGVTILLLWALCASRWSFRAFTPDTMMKVVHLFAVYLGALSVVMAALFGATYLLVERKLKNKQNLGLAKQFASLEALERMIVVSSAFGFAFISLGLVTGLVSITAAHEQMPLGWWYEPKIVLSFIVWVTYALLFNVRHTVFFRGSRAAWLSLLGMFLLLLTFGVVHNFTNQLQDTLPQNQGKQIDVQLEVDG